MDQTLLKILKKVYYKKSFKQDSAGNNIKIETGDIFDLKTLTKHYSTENLSPKELSYLQDSGYQVNDIVHDTHDENIRKLKEIINNPNLSMHNLLSAYIAGYGSFPRGRQPIMSYLFAQAVPLHEFYSSRDGKHCEICGVKKNFWLERGRAIFGRYAGNSWNECTWEFYIDLEEFSKLPPRAAAKEDLQIFSAVIDMIRNAPEGETPGKLEKRIKKSKQVPKCEIYALRGLLMTLAELGVMYNPFIKPLFDEFSDCNTRWEAERKVPGSSRSDIVLPLAGWRGEYGICEERFNELFGELLWTDMNT